MKTVFKQSGIKSFFFFILSTILTEYTSTLNFFQFAGFTEILYFSIEFLQNSIL